MVWVDKPEGLLGAAIIRALNARSPGARVLSELADLSAADRAFVTGGEAGGIQANLRYPADLMTDNLQHALAVLTAAREARVGRLLYLGSACMFPRDAPQPLGEAALLTGPLESSSEPYAIAKLAGVTLCQALRRQHGCRFVTAIPTNTFGPGDAFDPEQGHVIGALVHRIHAAREQGLTEVAVWGSGAAQREFLYVDDVADACLFLVDAYDGGEPINIAGGETLSIRELAEAIRAELGYRGRLRFDASKPEGVRLKQLDGSRLAALGWRPRTSFLEGLQRTCAWFLEHGARESAGSLPVQRA